MNGDYIGNPAVVVVALVALGMAFAFVSADRDSPASRSLALGFGGVGMSVYLNAGVLPHFAVPPAWTAWFALPEVLAMIGILGWILRVRRMVPATIDLDTRFGDFALRTGQFGAAMYGVFSLLWPDLRIATFLRASGNPLFFMEAGFWLFALPLLYAMLTATIGVALLMNRRPERAEAIRVLATAVAGPFLVAGLILPIDAATISVALGEMIFLVGATHYHVLQGQRGQFMSRFLSPQVARLVAEKGLARAMQETQREISIVCCDLRGFTPFAAAHTSTQVLQVLREYYDVVGGVVAEHGATIKDFAGDGILILVGAPLPVPQCARRALDMARQIRIVGSALTARAGAADYPLGLGIGIATGVVTVGVIGSASRLEYTAVGSPVNLACRLCEQAQNGEILVDARTADRIGVEQLQPRAAAAVKGFAEPVPRYALGL